MNGLEANFLKLMEKFTAGDPMREELLWTNLSIREIKRQLQEMGTPASRRVVKKLLAKHKLGQRKARKKKSLGAHPDRNAQFENIARLKEQYLAAGDPVISIDTKKKELIGNFSRDGHTHTQALIETLDHDFPTAGEGKVIPHGIYDLARNEGYVHLNTSADTSEFCCDSVAHWWQQHGHKQYPNAKRILILCDGGGSNASSRFVFPPYCSKHNPIEHRLFCHVTKACQGVIFHSVDVVKKFMERAKTSTGLKVTVAVLTGVYETGKKCAANFRHTMALVFDTNLPRWNYRAVPQAK
jgi:hypothetical protein